MKKNRIIPFSWLPSSWGLSGPLLAEQEARYYYEGAELEERLAEIYHEGEELEHIKLEIHRDYGIITEIEYQQIRAEKIADELERQIALLKLEAEKGEITEIEAEREIATLRGEPWIKVVADGLDLAQGIDGYYFEFDWNDLWITKLLDAGYTGADENQIVQAWFRDVCRAEASAALASVNGQGGLYIE